MLLVHLRCYSIAFSTTETTCAPVPHPTLLVLLLLLFMLLVHLRCYSIAFSTTETTCAPVPRPTLLVLLLLLVMLLVHVRCYSYSIASSTTETACARVQTVAAHTPRASAAVHASRACALLPFAYSTTKTACARALMKSDHSTVCYCLQLASKQSLNSPPCQAIPFEISVKLAPLTKSFL